MGSSIHLSSLLLFPLSVLAAIGIGGTDPIAEVYFATESESLSLISKEPNTEVLINPDYVRKNSSEQFQNVVLVCNAPFPIEWTYMGDGVRV
jgi:hypothetical protein